MEQIGMDSRFKANLQKLSRENRERIRWRKAVEAAEQDWKDCQPEDRTQMAGELAVLFQSLKSDISDSKTDELTQAELMDRIEALHDAIRGDQSSEVS
jgi:hypothetical protein